MKIKDSEMRSSKLIQNYTILNQKEDKILSKSSDLKVKGNLGFK
jgi:hypothetical protein